MEAILRFSSEISVEPIMQMGSDSAIMAAAKVLDGVPIGDDPTKLIRTLVEKRHGTPFEHGALTVRVHAPIKVWREWHRHRVGWSYNEESGRYKQLEPLFYLPPEERPAIRPPGFKSMDPSFLQCDRHQYDDMCKNLVDGYEQAYRKYESMLEAGIDRGLARDVLGVGIYSACWCTANPRSIMHFLELRTEKVDAKRPSKPLYEIRVAAEKLEAIFAKYWPITYRIWNENGRSAP